MSATFLEHIHLHQVGWFVLTVDVLLMAAAFISSTLTGNYSFVDREWSITPFAFCIIYAIASMIYPSFKSNSLPLDLTLLSNLPWNALNPALMDPRTAVIALLTTLWGLRLTYNFWRKGGYQPGEQDYRWPVLLKIVPWYVWPAFNLTFISSYQNLLLLLITLPGYSSFLASMMSPVPWTIWDSVSTGSFLVFLLIETIADNQQFAFQTKKYQLLAQQKKKSAASSSLISQIPAPYCHGFLTSGLFSYSRHPNFFGEVGMWWSLFGFVAHFPASTLSAIAPFMTVAEYTLPLWIGAFLLTTLFLGSTNFTEDISSSKYPLYKTYQQTTSMLVPWFPSNDPLRLNQSKKKN